VRAGLVLAGLLLASTEARASAPVRAQAQQLVAPMREAGDLFGFSVAIEGDLGVIGAPQRTVSPYLYAGEVFVLARSGGTWVVTGSLPEADTTEPSRDLGRALQMRDGLLAVGAPGRSAGRGGVYIYAYAQATGWALQALAASPEGVPGARLGSAVDLDGGLVFAGETAQTLPPADAVLGKVHVFDQALGWARVQVLAPLDAEGGDRFGFAVATAGELAVIGAPGKDGARGAAYVFERMAGVWMQTAKLVIADLRGPGDYFGAAVAIEPERILVGAYGRDAQAGAAYVFERPGGKWVQVQALTAEAPIATEVFGARVALRDGRALVSGWGYEPLAGVGSRGGAYLFVHDGEALVLQAALRADDGVPGDYLGLGAALSEDAALLGAPYDDAPAQPTPMLGSALGSAYVFTLGQAAGEPCVLDVDCVAGTRCCDAVCVALASCEVATTGESMATGDGLTGEGPGSSNDAGGSTGGLPEVEIDPRTEGCGCATGGPEIGGAWLGLWALGRRRRRRAM
jgi:uncharacterized protein (TIGR03382 family)